MITVESYYENLFRPSTYAHDNTWQCLFCSLEQFLPGKPTTERFWARVPFGPSPFGPASHLGPGPLWGRVPLKKIGPGSHLGPAHLGPRPLRARPGLGLGPIWVRPGLGLGPIWARPGLGLGPIWARPGWAWVPFGPGPDLGLGRIWAQVPFSQKYKFRHQI